MDLPEFAAYPLLDSIRGRSLLADYFSGYAAVAAAAGASLLLETPTWRANPQWVARLGGDDDVVRRITIDSAAFLADLAPTLGSNGDTLVLGMIGPRGDGYVAGESTSADEFASYHETQVAAFAQSAAAGVTGYTMTTVAEAVGIVLAAREYGLDVGVSFTVETDGRLPDGTPLADAVTSLWAQAAPDRLLLNCAHPSHFAAALADDASWTARVTGLRANASRQSHAELDAADTLDEGDLTDLVAEHERVAAHLPNLEVVGGCCGTDTRHVAALGGVDAARMEG